MLQYLPADELVISVDNDKYLMGLALFIGGPVDVGHGHSPILVDNNFQLLLRDLMLCRILLNNCSSAIIRSIVNKHDMIVRVVLLQNRVHVISYSITGIVVETGHNNTERLFRILRYIIFLLIILLLLF